MLFALVAIFAVGARWARIPDCPEAGCPTWGLLADYRSPEAPHLYDRHDRLAGHLPGEVRLWTSLDDVPRLLLDAIVALEDRRFFDHAGIDLRSVFRAAAANVQAGVVQEGGSTITMQLARNLWWPRLSQFDRWRRKVVEARIALRVEDELQKEDILELYLNRVYMGSGMYGFGTAAQHYYGKSPRDLSLSEIATLVGAVKTPERYDPRNAPESARLRRDVVLGVLEREGLVSHADAEAARAEAAQVVDDTPLVQGRGYFASAVNRELRAILPDPDVRSGARVYTTLDPLAQGAAERRLAEQIARIESGGLGRFDHPVPEDSLGRASGDSDYLQGAVVAMDAASGAVRAVVGGRSFEHSEFDRAFLATRQPGSAFKPIVYAAALQHRRITLAERVDTRPFELEVEDGVWAPADEKAAGEFMTPRTALARSSNWAAIRVGMKVGVARVGLFAASLGIASRVEAVPASFLGASVLRPVELAAAYAVFANGGRRVRPHLIRRIEDRDGRVLYRAQSETAQVLDPRVAHLSVQVLESVVDGGTGWRAREAGYRGPAAGKTGTTDEWRDAWFVGFNSELVTAVWVGFDHPQTITRNAFGGTAAAPIWGGIMADLYGEGRDAPGFPERPQGFRQVEIDAATGFTVSDRCVPEQPRVELFLPGTEPPAMCRVNVAAPTLYPVAWASHDFELAPPAAISSRRTGGGR